jgi:hypothetical protein
MKQRGGDEEISRRFKKMVYTDFSFMKKFGGE